MSILQDPLRSLEQIQWYLDHRQDEVFPGAFLLAAGNLARQLLEQILFVLAFYAGLPIRKYLRRDGRLHAPFNILLALKEAHPEDGNTYLEHARRRGHRIRKFARSPRSVDLWRRVFNEPSHFSNPVAGRRIKEKTLQSFVHRLRAILDPQDAHLVTAAINEIRSGGTVRANLGTDPDNTPGIELDAVVGPKDLILRKGRLTLRGPQVSIQVVPDDKEMPNRWKKRAVLVQHSVGIAIIFAFRNKKGNPIDIRDPRRMLEGLVTTKRDADMLAARLRQLGCRVQYEIRKA